MITLALLVSIAHASTLYDGSTLAEVPLEQAFTDTRPGDIWVLSEVHDQAAHHENQKRALAEIARAVPAVSVGLEFFERPDQDAVDRYVAGDLAESDFLRQIRWGSIPFDFYRDQALFPATHGGSTLALNAPRALTGRVSQVGIAGLTDAERAELPPGFTLGNDLYHERFAEIMGGHAPAAALARYFEAQSIWDETMALTATDFLRAHPEQTLVILVGDFHAAFGGGLPDRLKARGAARVRVVSQVLEKDEAAPDPRYGARGELVWVP